MQSIANETRTKEALRERIATLERLVDRVKRANIGFQVKALLEEARRMLADAQRPYVSPRCGKCGSETIERGVRRRGLIYDRCKSCGALWNRATQRWLGKLW